MKILEKQLKPVALILALVMLFQSCTVYKSNTITLDQAVQNESKVKVITKSSEKMKFERIGIDNGNYYGVKKTKNGILKTPLNKEFINNIKEKDKTSSTVLTIALPLTIVLVAMVIIGSSLNFDLGSGNWDTTF